MYRHSLFGLRVLTTRPLPGLTPLSDSHEADIQIQLGALPPCGSRDVPGSADTIYVSPHLDETGRPTLTVRRLDLGELFWLQYGDGIEFVVDRGGTTIWARWPEPWSVDDAATYLLGPVLGFVLRLRGITCLHASAVAIGDSAIAVVGPPGAGKSTLAAAFARLGHPVVSDDVVALSRHGRRFLAQPGCPRVRLWPDSVHALYGSTDALPRLTPSWDKRFLDLTRGGYMFQRQPLPLHAIYVLAERSSDAAAPRVEPLPCAAALMALVANTHANYLLDPPMRAQEFDSLGGVVGSVPMRRVQPHQNPALLSRLCDVIIDDALAGSHV